MTKVNIKYAGESLSDCFQIVDSEKAVEMCLCSSYEGEANTAQERGELILLALNYYDELKRLLREMSEVALVMKEPWDTDTYRDSILLLEKLG